MLNTFSPHNLLLLAHIHHSKPSSVLKTESKKEKHSTTVNSRSWAEPSSSWWIFKPRTPAFVFLSSADQTVGRFRTVNSSETYCKSCAIGFRFVGLFLSVCSLVKNFVQILGIFTSLDWYILRKQIVDTRSGSCPAESLKQFKRYICDLSEERKGLQKHSVNFRSVSEIIFTITWSTSTR